MNRKILIALVIINTAALLWGVRNYLIVMDAPMDEVLLQIAETPPMAQQSLEIIESYSDQEKIGNVNKIIHLYSKVVGHLDATKGLTLEAIDALYEDLYLYSVVALTNIGLLFYLLATFRYNKSLNSDTQKSHAS